MPPCNNITKLTDCVHHSAVIKSLSAVVVVPLVVTVTRQRAQMNAMFRVQVVWFPVSPGEVLDWRLTCGQASTCHVNLAQNGNV